MIPVRRQSRSAPIQADVVPPRLTAGSLRLGEHGGEAVAPLRALVGRAEVERERPTVPARVEVAEQAWEVDDAVAGQEMLLPLAVRVVQAHLADPLDAECVQEAHVPLR